MTSQKLKAASPFPITNVPALGGGSLSLGKPSTEGTDWQMVIIYRGKHCPICTKYLKQTNDMLDDFKKAGVEIVAVSADSEEQAKAQMDEVSPDFPIGYGLTVDQMKALGLYISSPRSPKETDHPFAEPGLFVVNVDGKVQIIDVANAPFARPDLETVLMGINFVRNPENDYPIRGTFE